MVYPLSMALLILTCLNSHHDVRFEHGTLNSYLLELPSWCILWHGTPNSYLPELPSWCTLLSMALLILTCLNSHHCVPFEHGTSTTTAKDVADVLSVWFGWNGDTAELGILLIAIGEQENGERSGTSPLVNETSSGQQLASATCD